MQGYNSPPEITATSTWDTLLLVRVLAQYFPVVFNDVIGHEKSTEFMNSVYEVLQATHHRNVRGHSTVLNTPPMDILNTITRLQTMVHLSSHTEAGHTVNREAARLLTGVMDDTRQCKYRVANTRSHCNLQVQ